MIKKLILALAILSVASQALADQCNSPGAPTQSVVVAASSTTRLVVGAAGISTNVCGYNFTAAAGTAATYTFNYGTGTTCGTGTTALTGAYAGGAAEVISASNPGKVFTVPPGQDLCITLGGSGGSAQGVLTYSQF
jgi:hypothetical protein